jgi:hypothetical protein
MAEYDFETLKGDVAKLRSALLDLTKKLIISAIPDHHSSRSIHPLRYNPFKINVFQWMIFYQNRKPLLSGIHRWPLRNSPGTETPVHFQTKVIVMVC